MNPGDKRRNGDRSHGSILTAKANNILFQVSRLTSSSSSCDSKGHIYHLKGSYSSAKSSDSQISFSYLSGKNRPCRNPSTRGGYRAVKVPEAKRLRLELIANKSKVNVLEEGGLF